MQDRKDKREVVILFHNHVDPEWARCFEDYAYNGRFFTRSYMDVFEWMVDEFIRLSGQGFCYSEGQTAFWEKYLERHPEKEEILRELVKNGQLEFLMQGYLTCDTNYAPAEGIIRNYLMAVPFYQTYGEGFAVNQAFVWDAFGSSANLPQILKLFGANRIGGTKYRPCTEKYWTGIDGSSLPCIDKRLGSCNLKGEPILYVCARHPHCPVCHGYGCEECQGRGMVNRHPFIKEEVLAVLESCVAAGEDKKFVLIGGEEVLPDRCIVEAAEELNKKYQGRIVFRFGTFREYWDSFQKDYELLSESCRKPGKELNPVNQGGYLTRTENKQRVRKAAYALLQAEAVCTARKFKNGGKPVLPSEIKQAWKYLLLNMHHDSISGAHIDAAQKELMGWLEECEKISAGFYRPEWKEKTSGSKKLLPKNTLHHKQLGGLSVTFDQSGILSVTTKGEDVFGTYMHQMTSPRSFEEQVRIGELMLQDDIGDLYGTYLLGEGICLGKYHYCVMEEENAILWRGSRDVRDVSAGALEWETRVEAAEDGRRLDFTVKLDGKMTNKRISAMIPVNDHTSNKAVWEIPFGFIERTFLTKEEAEKEIEAYDAPSLYERTAILPTGDYPALHWVRHDITKETGVALLNKGLPCNRYVPGCFILGLIRTPQMQGVTVMPHAEEMWDILGAGNAQGYTFEFSVYPYTKHVSNGELTKLGYEYNEANLSVPFQIVGNAQITAFKTAEKEDGFILRLFETEGKASEIQIFYHEERITMPVMADEETSMGKSAAGKKFTYLLHAHEILTLRIT